MNQSSKNNGDISEIPSLVGQLGKDVDECERILKESNSPLAKRNFTRALFAWIEAAAYLMRQFVLYQLKQEDLTIELMPKFLAASELTYHVGGDGEVKKTN